jgi:hypothetical protein
MDTFASSLGSRGDWREFDAEAAKAHIRECAGVPDLGAAHAAAKAASETFQEAQSEIVSILQNELEEKSDEFLGDLKKKIEELQPA